jgi:hypothetical protein
VAGNTKTIHIANFICRFGDEQVLLDLAEEIVLPAFLERRERRYSTSRFFFDGIELVDFGTKSSPELLIVGRLVHDTSLVREQVLQNGALVKDHATLASAPSALFALVLDTHKLLYLPETRYAPSIAAFRATAAYFIRMRHKEFLRAKLRSMKKAKQEITRAELLVKYPLPTIEVIPLSSEASLAEFLDQFKVLREIRIELVEPNDELDSEWLIKHMRATKGSLDATTGELAFKGTGDGLSRSAALKEISPIAEQANTKITFTGYDPNGDKLTGDNHHFKMGMPIEDVGSHPRAAGYDLYGAFRDKVKAGLLKVQEVGQNARQKLIRLSVGATRLHDTSRK